MKFNAIKYTMDNLMRDWYTSYTAGIGPDLDDTRIKKWLYQGTSDDYVISRMKSDYKGSAYFKHLPYDKSQDVRYTDNDGFVRLKDSVFSDDNIMNYRLGMYSNVMGWSHNGMDSDTAWNHYKFLTSKIIATNVYLHNLLTHLLVNILDLIQNILANKISGKH